MSHKRNIVSRRELREQTVSQLLEQVDIAPNELSIIDAIDKFRVERGLRDMDLATVLGVSYPQFSSIMNGRRNLPRHAVLRAVVLGIPINVFHQYMKHEND